MKKISFLMLAFAMLASACTTMAQESRRDIELKGDFTSIGLSVSGKVHLTKGACKVEAVGPENVLDDIEYIVKNGSLEIKRKSRYSRNNSKSVTFYISVPQLEGISIAGSGEVIGKDAFDSQKDLDISIAGSGKVLLAGSGNKISVSIAGSGDVNLADFNGQDCSIDISGSGSAKVGDVKQLSASIAGSGKVKYRSAEKVSSSVAGSGKVETF
jgi:hypothetical protein